MLASVRDRLQLNIDYHDQMAEHHAREHEKSRAKAPSAEEKPNEEEEFIIGGESPRVPRRSVTDSERSSAEAGEEAPVKEEEVKSQDQTISEMHADVAKQLREVMGEGRGPVIRDVHANRTILRNTTPIIRRRR
jgi:hypothetical protein